MLNLCSSFHYPPIMKASQIPIAFLFILPSFICMNCSKDGQDLEEEEEITEICVPELNSPGNGAQIDNGCSDSSNPVIWSFDWEDCVNTSYNLVVKRSEDTIPYIDELVDDSEFMYNNPSAYIADTIRTGWTWKVRALVDGEEGEWSEVREFSVEPVDSDCEDDEGFFTDPRDGHVYKTVQIGDQVWMAENLRSIIYSDGSPIPLIEDAALWEVQFGTSAYCWYDNNTSNQYTYGALYNYYAIMNGEQSSDQNPSGVQGVCPSGWHLPSDDEWKQLEIYLGMTQNEADNLGWRGTNEGSKLAGSLDLWIGSGDLTESSEFESSEFSAVPAGHRNPDFIISDFADLGSGASWWSATDSYAREIQIPNSTIYRNSFDPLYGFAVRCVKDKQ